MSAKNTTLILTAKRNRKTSRKNFRKQDEQPTRKKIMTRSARRLDPLSPVQQQQMTVYAKPQTTYSCALLTRKQAYKLCFGEETGSVNIIFWETVISIESLMSQLDEDEIYNKDEYNRQFPKNPIVMCFWDPTLAEPIIEPEKIMTIEISNEDLEMLDNADLIFDCLSFKQRYSFVNDEEINIDVEETPDLCLFTFFTEKEMANMCRHIQGVRFHIMYWKDVKSVPKIMERLSTEEIGPKNEHDKNDPSNPVVMCFWQPENQFVMDPEQVRSIDITDDDILSFLESNILFECPVERVLF